MKLKEMKLKQLYQHNTHIYNQLVDDIIVYTYIGSLKNDKDKYLVYIWNQDLGNKIKFISKPCLSYKLLKDKAFKFYYNIFKSFYPKHCFYEKFQEVKIKHKDYKNPVLNAFIFKLKPESLLEIQISQL